MIITFKYISRTAALILLFLSLSQNSSRCQVVNALFDHITVEDGLSNSLIFEMTQDSLGFVWIATQDGLNRYDGYEFKVFRGDDSVKTVSDNWISCITTDRNGNLWYGTRTAGIGKIDVTNGKFYSFKDRLTDEFGTDALNIQNLFITKENKILIGTWGAGLLIFSPDENKFYQYKKNNGEENSISENRIYSVFEDSNGNIWAGSQRSGLSKIEKSNGKITHFNFISKDPLTVSNNFVLTITEDYSGTIWVGTYSDGLYSINPGDNSLRRYGAGNNMNGNRISKVYEDRNKNLWVCTNGNGIFRYVREKNSFVNYLSNQIDPKSLNTDKVWSLMEDKNGLLWFGTISNGINIFNKNKNEFNRFINNKNDKNTIIGNYVKSLMFDKKKNLWVGTQRGITIFSRDNSVKHITEKDGLNVNDIRNIYERKSGEIWIATWGGGLNIYNPATKRFQYLVHDPNNSNSLADNYMRSILGVDGKMYIGTERGLNEYDPLTGDFKLFNSKGDTSISLSNSEITYLFIDSKDVFWVGTNLGLNIFDRLNGTFKKVHIQDSDIIHQRKRIRKIFEDTKGNIWIGTLGGGFAKYDPVSKEFDFYNQKDGLSNNAVFEILEDDDGFLWISTSIGINKFNSATKEFVVFKQEDGLPNNEFNAGAAVKDEAGILYFGGVNGMVSFNPNQLKIENKVPKLEITKILVNGTELDEYGFYNRKESIELPYNQNFIDISYAALDYFDPKSNTFKYKLEGLNESWIESGKEHKAVFTNLEHGTYIFRLKGANKFGVWNNAGLSLKIIIYPPWWDTIWARIVYLLILILIIYGVFRFREKNLKDKQKQLERQVYERTKDLQENKIKLEQAVAAKDKLFSLIAHDLKNPFVALLGYSQLLKENDESLGSKERRESIDGIYNASNAVYSLLLNLLDWARLQVESIECYPESLEVSPIIENVFHIFSTTAASKSISLKNKIEPGTVILADQNMTETIFRNIISNAIKFTGKGGEVSAMSQIVDSRIQIIIEDNGVGIDDKTLSIINKKFGHMSSIQGTSNEKGTGLGLMLVKDFVAKNSGILEIISAPGKGTKVIISFKKPPASK